jgi:hypothetical protein
MVTYDATGAVIGAVVGAYWRASKLPPHLKDAVLCSDVVVMKADLIGRAEQLTEQIMARGG